MANEIQRKTFLSYSRINKDFALKLAKELKSEGFDIWLDQLDIPPGARWDAEVEKALEESEIFMIIITPASAKSENVLDEIGYAIDSGKRILPVLLETATLPLRLRRFQYIDFTSKSFNEGIESAKELLRTLITEPTMPDGEAEAENRATSALAGSMGMKAGSESTAPSQNKPPARGLVIGVIAVAILGFAGIGYAILSKGGSSDPSANSPGPATIPATETLVMATSTVVQPEATLAIPDTPAPTGISIPTNADVVDVANQVVFVQSAMSGDMVGRTLFIDHELAYDRDALVFAMPNFTSPEPPPGMPGVYYDFPVCVAWTNESQWTIVKKRGMDAIPFRTAFNVHIVSAGNNAFIHTATAENTEEYWTVLDTQKYPLASDANALVFATFNLSASTGRGEYFDNPIGVLYKDGKWAIYNRNRADMPEGAAFNVQIVSQGTNAFVHRVEPTAANWTAIKDPNGSLITDANALIFVMPRGTLEDNGEIYDQNIGVYLSGQFWAIFNQNKTVPMTEGVEFNILVLEPG